MRRPRLGKPPFVRRLHGWLVLSALLMLSLSWLSCGGGGSSPTEPSPMPRTCIFPEPPASFPDRNATFTPDAAGPANSISLQAGDNCSDLLVINILATGVADLHTLRFTIDFDEAILGFDNSRLGPFLSENSTVQVIAMSDELQRPAGSPGVSGSGQILTQAYVYQGPIGRVDMALSGEGLDSNGDIIPGLVFVGGSATISQ